MKFFRKSEVLLPSRSGVFLFLLLTGVLGVGLSQSLYPFLAQNKPLKKADLIIIEGWLPDAELAQLITNIDPHAVFVTTGGPIKFGGTLFDDKTYAEITTMRLQKMGISLNSILTASAPDTVADRTYTSALAVRDTLEEHDLFGRPTNLYTLGAHSRRSFLLYRFAFDFGDFLGVVSLENEELDLHRWFRSSLAFRHVVNEAIAWLYVQCTRWRY